MTKLKEAKILDHQQIVEDGMKKIYGDRKYSDIILINKGKQYRCHRIILYAFTPKWQKCLKTVSPNSKVLVGNISGGNLENLLELLYLGQVKIRKIFSDEFMGEIKNFGIEGHHLEEIAGNQSAFVLIKIKNHYRILSDCFHKCLSKAIFTDCALFAASGGFKKRVEGHRIVFSWFCTEMNQLFDEPNDPIYLFFHEECLKRVLGLIYKGYSGIEQRGCDSIEFEQAFHSLSCKGELQIEAMDEDDPRYPIY